MAAFVRRANPYVGPRSFRQGEQIYGRAREADQLTNLLVAERIVLLYSPSGAGKSSLIHASLIPRLSAMKFRVRPVVRVNLNPAAAPGGTHAYNRYIFSTLLSLEEEAPDGQKIPPERLAAMSLKEYLAEQQGADNSRNIEVLIFDQFEEILSLDPTDQEAKREFFRQVGEVLEETNYWALFSMREDLVTALDPYLLLVPSWLSNTFRLDLLGVEAARLAIQQPALKAGVEFEDVAVEKLVDDLRRVRVQRLDGMLEPQLGPYIEPVQLQLVCHRLWDLPRPNPRWIREEDLAAFGEVDQSLVDRSLAEYYAHSVKSAAMETGASERSIREWFDQKLIMEQGLRGTVLMGAGGEDEPDSRAIQKMVDAHLVRAEKRGGATWFELAHDRLIGPVRADNASWFSDHLSLLQKQAGLWNQQGRPERLLLRGADLIEAEIWASTSSEELLNDEVEFLRACRFLHERERRSRRLSQLIVFLGIVSMALAVIAFSSLLKAERQARLARSGLLASQAQTSLERFPQRGLLLAIEANRILKASDPSVPAARAILRAALVDPHGRVLSGHENDVVMLAFSPDGRWLATTSDDTLRLWDLEAEDPAEEAHALRDLGPKVTSLAFSPDGRWLATAIEDTSSGGSVLLLDPRVADPLEGAVSLSGHGDQITRLAFSPDGRWLATSSLDTNTLLWDLDAIDGGIPRQLSGHQSSILALSISPDSRWLATGDLQGNTLMWDLKAEDPAAYFLTLDKHQRQITSLVFSPDGQWLASGSLDNTVQLWAVSTAGTEGSALILSGHEDGIKSVSFSPDSRWLATGSVDTTARLWDIDSNDPNTHFIELRGHDDEVTALAFTSDGGLLATASKDHTARLWELGFTGTVEEPTVLRGHDDQVTTLAFSLDGHWLATGSFDNTARLWDMEGSDPAANPIALRGHTGGVTALAFSPDGRWLATSSVDRSARLWEPETANPSVERYVLQGHEASITSLAISSDGRWLATGSGDQTARLWNLKAEDPSAVAIILRGHTSWIGTLAFSPDGQWLATGSGDQTARLWDLESANPGANFRDLHGHNDEITTLAFSPDSRLLATGSRDRTVRLWNLQPGNPVDQAHILHGHEAPINTLEFSPDGRWLASGSVDSTARLWRPKADDPTAQSIVLSAHNGWVETLAFSPDGRWLATGSGDQIIRLWDLKSTDPGANARELRGHDDEVTTLAFSPDGRWLATGSEDRTARLWNIQANDPVAEGHILQGHAGAITTLAFSVDSHWLATGSSDRTVRLWPVSQDELIRLACASAGRNLSQQEWKQFFSGEDYRVTCDRWPEGQ
jgi:WD40 repeat protein